MKQNQQGSLLLFIILALFIILLAAAGSYWWQNISQREESEPALLTPKAEADPTDGWQTYLDSKYELSFKYPADWQEPEVDDIKADQAISLIDYRYVDFKESGYRIRSVDLSFYKEYQDTNQEEDLEKLKEVYQSQSAAGADEIWLPHGNAAFGASTKPEYLETEDGQYRGIYYFANIGQAYTTDLDCLVIMTDGASKIFQLHIAKKSDYSDQYEVEFSGSSSEYSKAYQKYYDYVETIDSQTSDESLVEEFNSIYKYIALSLETIE